MSPGASIALPETYEGPPPGATVAGIWHRPRLPEDVRKWRPGRGLERTTNRLTAWRGPGGLSREVLLDLVARHTEQPWLGFFGEPRVNVLLLNLAVDELVR